MYFLDYILLVISILLIVIIVLQSPKEDVQNAFSGEVISITTTVLSIAFFVVAFLIAILERLDFII